MKKDDVLTRLRELKPKYEKEGFVIVGLFGSFATGQDDEYSDIDVAIKIDDEYLVKNDVWNYFDAVNSLKFDISKELGRKADIFDIQSSSHINAKLQREIAYV